VRRAVLLALLLAVAGAAAGCGEATEVREPDLVARGASPAAGAGGSADGGDSERDAARVQIAVVTHGQASDAFWTIVKNGIDAAARQADVSVDYRSPDVFSVDRMRLLVDEAVARKPDGLIVSLPSEGLLPSVRAAVDAGIPVVSINSGSDFYRRAGAIAHIGQPEDRAGLAAGERMVRAGVRRGLCVNQEVGNEGLDLRCAGFARALRRVGGRSRVLAVDTKDLAETRRRISAAMTEERIDGVLTLNNASGEAALSVLPADVELATFDMNPLILQAVRRGRMLFAVDQQPYLQGYLPVVFLTELARHGIFPAQGDVIPTGPNFVTEETASQAIRLSQQGIR
jgi:simple sugar transport system substrate-binding protein